MFLKRKPRDEAHSVAVRVSKDEARHTYSTGCDEWGGKASRLKYANVEFFIHRRNATTTRHRDRPRRLHDISCMDAFSIFVSAHPASGLPQRNSTRVARLRKVHNARPWQLRYGENLPIAALTTDMHFRKLYLLVTIVSNKNFFCKTGRALIFNIRQMAVGKRPCSIKLLDVPSACSGQA